jgi:hypothetical protein
MSDKAFLTDIDAGGDTSSSANRRRAEPNSKLDGVRKEHDKIMEVVGAFNKKVGNMIDKQRAEYLAAYEHHMQDIQRELHVLRETVAEIAGDKTRTEKLASLSKDEQYFKNEALIYDIETNELRKKLHGVTGTMHTIERERDWFLKKLRSAKKHYNYLKSERARVLKNSTDANSVMSNSTASQDGLYSIELNRKSKSSSHLMSERSKSTSKVLNANATIEEVLSQSSFGSIQKLQSTYEKNDARLDSERQKKWATGQLVKVRAKREAMRDFIDQCSKSCEKGIWLKIAKRPLHEVLSDCLSALDISDEYEKMKRISELSPELAAIPLVYDIIASFLISGSTNPVLQRFEEFANSEAVDITTEQTVNIDPLNQPLFTKEDDEEPASHDIEFNDILSNDILLYLRGSNSNIKLERDDTINEKDFLNFE